MKKKINMNLENYEPYIKSFWHWSDQLIIIKSVDKDNYWLCNNFINLKADIDCLPGGISFSNLEYRNKMVEFFDCPYINMQRKVINKQQFDIIKEVESNINDNWYVLIMVDRFYIESYIYKYKKSYHQIMIYGYDSDRELIYFCDNDTDGKYTTNLCCTYSELRKAFMEFDFFDQEPDFENSVFLLQGRNNDEYKLNIPKIKRDLIKYLHSEKNTNWTRFNLIYGIDIYKELIENLTKYEIQDIKGLYVIYDHKKVMMLRLETLLKDKYVTYEMVKEYKKIVDMSRKILLCYLKFFVSSEKGILNKCVEYLQQMRELEIIILEQIVVNLKNI